MKVRVRIYKSHVSPSEQANLVELYEVVRDEMDTITLRVDETEAPIVAQTYHGVFDVSE